MQTETSSAQAAQQEGPGPVPALAALTAAFAALRQAPPQQAASGHCDLGSSTLWLSTDPEGQAVLSCAPAAEGLELSLEHGDSGRWASLGFQLPPAALAQARYFGLLLRASSSSLLIYTAVLRYHSAGGGFEETAAAPTVLPAAEAAQEHLSYLPVDQARLAASSGCEVNLFFQTDRFRATLAHLEPLIMR